MSNVCIDFALYALIPLLKKKKKILKEFFYVHLLHLENG